MSRASCMYCVNSKVLKIGSGVSTDSSIITLQKLINIDPVVMEFCEVVRTHQNTILNNENFFFLFCKNKNNKFPFLLILFKRRVESSTVTHPCLALRHFSVPKETGAFKAIKSFYPLFWNFVIRSCNWFR